MRAGHLKASRSTDMVVDLVVLTLGLYRVFHTCGPVLSNRYGPSVLPCGFFSSFQFFWMCCRTVGRFAWSDPGHLCWRRAYPIHCWTLKGVKKQWAALLLLSYPFLLLAVHNSAWDALHGASHALFIKQTVGRVDNGSSLSDSAHGFVLVIFFLPLPSGVLWNLLCIPVFVCPRVSLRISDYLLVLSPHGACCAFGLSASRWTRESVGRHVSPRSFPPT